MKNLECEAKCEKSPLAFILPLLTLIMLLVTEGIFVMTEEPLSFFTPSPHYYRSHVVVEDRTRFETGESWAYGVRALHTKQRLIH